MTILFTPPVYAPLEPSAYNLIWVYAIVLISNFCFCLMMWHKYIIKKSKPGLYLSITFSFYVLIMLTILIGFLEAYISGLKKELYMTTIAIAYSSISITNCFLILFAMNVFKTEKDMKYAIKYIIFSIMTAILLALPYNYYGWNGPDIPEQWASFRTITSMLLMLSSFIIYYRIYKEAQRVSKIVEENWAKKGFQYISYAQISWIVLFLMLLADTIYDLIASVGGYTFFYYIAWSMMILATYFFYIGYLMPEWFRNKNK